MRFSIKNGVSILIPTWNNLEYLRACVDSIRSNSTFDHEILLHINDGSDGTLDYALAEGIKHTHSKENLGVCIAINQCADLVEKDYIAYFNDDMVALPGWDVEIENFCAEHKIPFTSWISGTMVEGFGHNDCCIAQGERFNYGRTVAEFDEQRIMRDLPRLREIKPSISGSSWPPNIMHRSMWDRAGGFSEEYSPGMGSDPDLAMKLFRNGCRHFISVSRSLIYHFGSKSTSQVPLNNGESLFVRKYGIPTQDFLYRVLGRGVPWRPDLPMPIVKSGQGISLAALVGRNDHGYIIGFLQQMGPFFDDIVLVLDGELPETAELVDDYIQSPFSTVDPISVKIVRRELNGDFGTQRNYAQSLCKEDWVLHADPDERFDYVILAGLREIAEDMARRGARVCGFPRLDYLDGILVNDIPREEWDTEGLARHRLDAADPEQLAHRDIVFRLMHRDVEWVRKVHEFPAPLRDDKSAVTVWDRAYVRHRKTLKRQDVQDRFYEKLQPGASFNPHLVPMEGRRK